MKLLVPLAIAAMLLVGAGFGSAATSPSGALATATAALEPTAPSLQASGQAVLDIQNPSDATVKVTLWGTLNNITMSHVHWNTSSGPVLLGLLPASNTTAIIPINPPISVDGTLTWSSPVSLTPALAATPGMDMTLFAELLKNGTLYVNVHTTEFPAGALVGSLQCAASCLG